MDNFNGMKLIGRLVRVDHVHTYKLPKDLEKMDADRRYNIARVGWDIQGLSTKIFYIEIINLDRYSICFVFYF